MAEQRFGIGFDVHPRSADLARPLFLAGVRFPGEVGLAGHSDGDAVCHAVADALLGAVALGDVGEHFPDTDPDVAGIEGMDLLSSTVAKVRAAGCTPRSADVTVVADRPAVAPHRDEMRRNLASALSVPVESVSVKASRPEGLGLSGDGAACIALVVLDVG